MFRGDKRTPAILAGVACRCSHETALKMDGDARRPLDRMNWHLCTNHQHTQDAELWAPRSSCRVRRASCTDVVDPETRGTVGPSVQSEGQALVPSSTDLAFRVKVVGISLAGALLLVDNHRCSDGHFPPHLLLRGCKTSTALVAEVAANTERLSNVLIRMGAHSAVVQAVA